MENRRRKTEVSVVGWKRSESWERPPIQGQAQQQLGKRFGYPVAEFVLFYPRKQRSVKNQTFVE